MIQCRLTTDQPANHVHAPLHHTASALSFLLLPAAGLPLRAGAAARLEYIEGPIDFPDPAPAGLSFQQWLQFLPGPRPYAQWRPLRAAPAHTPAVPCLRGDGCYSPTGFLLHQPLFCIGYFALHSGFEG